MSACSCTSDSSSGSGDNPERYGQTYFSLPPDEPRDRRHAVDRPERAGRRAGTSARSGSTSARSPSSASSGAWAARSSRCRCRAGLPSAQPACGSWTAGRATPTLDWLYSTVERLTQTGQPADAGSRRSTTRREVNAFATGPSKSRSLVAVSTGLLQAMRQDEVEGVLAHEVAHIANGDMVTMTLLQGVINAFVMFFARMIAFALPPRHRATIRNSQASAGSW